MATFNPYAKGIPEKKEFKSHIVEKPPVLDKKEAAKKLDSETKQKNKDLLDGLESNLRRQHGWAEDDNKNELCDGIPVIQISKADLAKKLAAQKRGGFSNK